VAVRRRRACSAPGREPRSGALPRTPGPPDRLDYKGKRIVPDDKRTPPYTQESSPTRPWPAALVRRFPQLVPCREGRPSEPVLRQRVTNLQDPRSKLGGASCVRTIADRTQSSSQDEFRNLPTGSMSGWRRRCRLHSRTALGDILKCCVRARRLWLVVLTSCGVSWAGPDPLEPGATDSQAEVRPTETADACLGFTNQSRDKLLMIQATNACERKLACRLSYVLRCYDNGQPPPRLTSQTKHERAFRLAAKGSAELSLSAETCKQGWSIDEVSWVCR
jgi:hypothetical protein